MLNFIKAIIQIFVVIQYVSLLSHLDGLAQSGTGYTLDQYTEHDEYNTPSTERDRLEIPSMPVQLLLSTKILHVPHSHVACRLLP